MQTVMPTSKELLLFITRFRITKRMHQKLLAKMKLEGKHKSLSKFIVEQIRIGIQKLEIDKKIYIKMSFSFDNILIFSNSKISIINYKSPFKDALDIRLISTIIDAYRFKNTKKGIDVLNMLNSSELFSFDNDNNKDVKKVTTSVYKFQHHDKDLNDKLEILCTQLKIDMSELIRLLLSFAVTSDEQKHQVISWLNSDYCKFVKSKRFTLDDKPIIVQDLINLVYTIPTNTY